MTISIQELLAQVAARKAQAQGGQSSGANSSTSASAKAESLATRKIVTNYGLASVQKDVKRSDKAALSARAEGNFDSSNIVQAKDLDNIALDASQEEALRVISSHKLVALTGAAGTGKTTVLRAFIRRNPPQFHWNHLRVGRVTDTLFLSLTGKAVSQMRLVLPKEYATSCMTIHSALAVIPEQQEDGRRLYVPRYTAANKLECKRVFIDESTMCSVSLWNQLREALPDDCAVCFIGDINQLPPVGGQPILAHALITFPYAALEKVHRQADASPVLHASHLVLRGEPISTMRGLVIRKVPNDPMDAHYAIVRHVVALFQNGQFDPMQDQIITAGNGGPLGQEELNAALLPHLVRSEMMKVFYARRFRVFAIGTKVMYTENDYELGIFNGLQGVVEKIEPNPARDADFEFECMTSSRVISDDDLDAPLLEDMEDIKQRVEEDAIGVTGKDNLDEDDAGREASHVVTVLFNDGTRVQLHKAKHIGNLIPSFVCTCHKMQGSECRKAIIVVHKDQSIHHSREWLYTALTRAKESALLFTSTTISKRKINIVAGDSTPTQSLADRASLNTSIQQCIDSPRILGRSTAEKIRAYIRIVMMNRDAEQPHWLPHDKSDEVA